MKSQFRKKNDITSEEMEASSSFCYSQLDLGGERMKKPERRLSY